jgi:hypothetical protein
MKTKTQERLEAATGTTPRHIRQQAKTSNSAVIHYLKSQGRVRGTGKRLIVIR